MSTKAQSGYVSVNGLRMYYEIHGDGPPLILLHGGLTTIETSFAGILPSLARTRRVIAVEQQAHGRTADIDRPLTFEQEANNTAVLLEQLEIENTDVFGYSDGGIVGLVLRSVNRISCESSYSPGRITTTTDCTLRCCSS
jgi:pimeloyl-ACP methyl ester carboxylesterase